MLDVVYLKKKFFPQIGFSDLVDNNAVKTMLTWFGETVHILRHEPYIRALWNDGYVFVFFFLD